MNENIYEQVQKFSYVYIFGAGRVGKIVIDYFMLNYPDININAIVVTELMGNPFYIHGTPIVDINSLKNVEDAIIIVAVLEKSQPSIIDMLLESGFYNIIGLKDETISEWEMNKREINKWEINKLPKKYIYAQRYIQPYLHTLADLEQSRGKSDEDIRKLIDKKVKNLYIRDTLNLARIVIVLGTKCSLRCAECSNLMPYFKPQTDLNVEKILRSIEILLNQSSSILKCELIGGEPFISKNLDAILRYVISRSEIDTVEITTNGTIIPKMDLIPILQNSKVNIRISYYGQVVDQSKIVAFCQDNNIRYQVIDMDRWISPGGIKKRNKSISELKKEYEKCTAGYLCKTLYEDKLFSCARSASLFELGFMKEEEYLTIDSNSSIDNIKDFLLMEYSLACDYCDMQQEKKIYVEPAIQE